MQTLNNGVMCNVISSGYGSLSFNLWYAIKTYISIHLNILDTIHSLITFCDKI